MAPNLDSLTKKAYRQLLDAAIGALEKAEMTNDELRKASSYITNNMDVVASPEELILLLRDLGNRWDCFKPVHINFKQEEVQTEDAQKLADLQAKLRQIANLP
jgi:maltodextrin utilization protein YvdJ